MDAILVAKIISMVCLGLITWLVSSEYIVVFLNRMHRQIVVAVIYFNATLFIH